MTFFNIYKDILKTGYFGYCPTPFSKIKQMVSIPKQLILLNCLEKLHGMSKLIFPLYQQNLPPDPEAKDKAVSLTKR